MWYARRWQAYRPIYDRLPTVLLLVVDGFAIGPVELVENRASISQDVDQDVRVAANA